MDAKPGDIKVMPLQKFNIGETVRTVDDLEWEGSWPTIPRHTIGTISGIEIDEECDNEFMYTLSQYPDIEFDGDDLELSPSPCKMCGGTGKVTLLLFDSLCECV